MKTAVLIPCYNEELTIEKVIKDFKRELPDADIYVYDNNSKDKTAQIAKDSGAIVIHEYKQGKGNVIRSMFRDVDADIYVMTHTTAPFISAESIQKGISAVCTEDYDSAFAAKKLQDFLWKDGKPFNYKLTDIPRTQDLPVIYEETSGFYIYKSSVIIENERRIGERPFIVEVGEIESIDIDEAEDFIIADAIYNHIFLKQEI